MKSQVIEISAVAKVICDSIFQGSRLTSVEVEFPRPYLAEFNTHTRFSRNSASSRAMPVWKRLLAVLERPYVPNSFGANKPGMQAKESLSEEDQKSAVSNWLVGRDIAVIQAYYLAGGKKEIMTACIKTGNQEQGEWLCTAIEELVRKYGMTSFLFKQDQGLHKQHANRVLEPYAFHTVIVTASHWRNFFGLRASTKAQPEANDFGIAIAKAMMASTPQELHVGQWHLPYVRQEDLDEISDMLVLARASSGKCARTSYLTHDGVRAISKDLELATDLQKSGHMSPFQHPARPREDGDADGSWGNYSPVWTQYRKLIDNEGDFTKLINREELLLGCRGDQELCDFILSLTE
jgi:hypothetical protein